jgi:hypothetical protein
MTNAELARRCACSFMEAESVKEREIAAAARYRRRRPVSSGAESMRDSDE